MHMAIYGKYSSKGGVVVWPDLSHVELKRSMQLIVLLRAVGTYLFVSAPYVLISGSALHGTGMGHCSE